MRDTFASQSFRQSGLWTPTWWDRALQRLENGETALAWTVWQPFIIEQWKQGFLSRVVRGRTEAPAA